tara:strand:+ start:282 stop:584 length:303 start_codon:yes stop_codon:yes gene_type:complete
MKVSNHKDYALFDYSQYLHRGQEATCHVPEKNRPFDLGSIVYIKDENAIGVVIGCVDYETEDLRTDMSGMQGFCQVELATKEHLKIKDVRLTPQLKKELS